MLEVYRDRFAADLSQPITDCVERKDTRWPVFSGCVDWHSAVHAHFALASLAASMHDTSLIRPLVLAATPDAVAEEMSLVESGVLDHENPYGFAWLLVASLAWTDTADRRFAELADAAAAQLALRYRDEPLALSRDLSNDNYDNAAWAILNLHRYASSRNDGPLATELEGWLATTAPTALSELGCGTAESKPGTEFFEPCLLLVHALGTIVPCIASEWVATTEPGAWIRPDLGPDTIVGSHHAGQNFSRAWGYRTLHVLTGAPEFDEAYARSLLAHWSLPGYWRSDYLRHAHWIAQFGIYALALSDPDSIVYEETSSC